MSTSDFKTLQETLDALKLCHGTGVKIVVSCPEMFEDEPLVVDMNWALDILEKEDDTVVPEESEI